MIKKINDDLFLLIVLTLILLSIFMIDFESGDSDRLPANVSSVGTTTSTTVAPTCGTASWQDGWNFFNDGSEVTADNACGAGSVYRWESGPNTLGAYQYVDKNNGSTNFWWQCYSSTGISAPADCYALKQPKVELKANSTTINAGDSVTLSLKTENVVSCTSPQVDFVPNVSSPVLSSNDYKVTPSANVTYSVECLSVYNSNDKFSASVNVTVNKTGSALPSTGVTTNNTVSAACGIASWHDGWNFYDNHFQIPSTQLCSSGSLNQGPLEYVDPKSNKTNFWWQCALNNTYSECFALKNPSVSLKLNNQSDSSQPLTLTLTTENVKANSCTGVGFLPKVETSVKTTTNYSISPTTDTTYSVSCLTVYDDISSKNYTSTVNFVATQTQPQTLLTITEAGSTSLVSDYTSPTSYKLFENLKINDLNCTVYTTIDKNNIDRSTALYDPNTLKPYIKADVRLACKGNILDKLSTINQFIKQYKLFSLLSSRDYVDLSQITLSGSLTTNRIGSKSSPYTNSLTKSGILYSLIYFIPTVTSPGAGNTFINIKTIPVDLNSNFPQPFGNNLSISLNESTPTINYQNYHWTKVWGDCSPNPVDIKLQWDKYNFSTGQVPDRSVTTTQEPVAHYFCQDSATGEMVTSELCSKTNTVAVFNQKSSCAPEAPKMINAVNAGNKVQSGAVGWNCYNVKDTILSSKLGTGEWITYCDSTSNRGYCESYEYHTVKPSWQYYEFSDSYSKYNKLDLFDSVNEARRFTLDAAKDHCAALGAVDVVAIPYIGTNSNFAFGAGYAKGAQLGYKELNGQLGNQAMDGSNIVTVTDTSKIKYYFNCVFDDIYGVKKYTYIQPEHLNSSEYATDPDLRIPVDILFNPCDSRGQSPVSEKGQGGENPYCIAGTITTVGPQSSCSYTDSFLKTAESYDSEWFATVEQEMAIANYNYVMGNIRDKLLSLLKQYLNRTYFHKTDNDLVNIDTKDILKLGYSNVKTDKALIATLNFEQRLKSGVDPMQAYQTYQQEFYSSEDIESIFTTSNERKVGGLLSIYDASLKNKRIDKLIQDGQIKTPTGKLYISRVFTDEVSIMGAVNRSIDYLSQELKNIGGFDQQVNNILSSVNNVNRNDFNQYSRLAGYETQLQTLLESTFGTNFNWPSFGDNVIGRMDTITEYRPNGTSLSSTYRGSGFEFDLSPLTEFFASSLTNLENAIKNYQRSLAVSDFSFINSLPNKTYSNPNFKTIYEQYINQLKNKIDGLNTNNPDVEKIAIPKLDSERISKDNTSFFADLMSIRYLPTKLSSTKLLIKKEFNSQGVSSIELTNINPETILGRDTLVVEKYTSSGETEIVELPEITRQSGNILVSAPSGYDYIGDVVDGNKLVFWTSLFGGGGTGKTGGKMNIKSVSYYREYPMITSTPPKPVLSPLSPVVPSGFVGRCTLGQSGC